MHASRCSKTGCWSLRSAASAASRAARSADVSLACLSRRMRSTDRSSATLAAAPDTSEMSWSDLRRAVVVAVAASWSVRASEIDAAPCAATRARATWMSISRADWRMRSSSRMDCTADLRMDLLIFSMARSNSFIAASYLAFCAGDGLELELRRSADMAAKTTADPDAELRRRGRRPL